MVDKVDLVKDDTGALDADGFSISDSQDNFDLLVSQINTQAMVKKSCEEPAVIEPGVTSVDDDGFWKSSNSDELDKLASQAIVKKTLKENNQQQDILGKKKGSLTESKKELNDRKERSNVVGTSSRKIAVAKVSKKTKKNEKENEKIKPLKKSKVNEGDDGVGMKKLNDVQMKKASRKKLDYEPRKKKRRLPDVSVEDLSEMVPSLDAEKILFEESEGKELDSCEVLKGNIPGIDASMDGESDVEFRAEGLVQSSQIEKPDANCEVENLSQEIKDKVHVEPVKKGCIKKSSGKEDSSKKSSAKKTVKVAPVKFFGCEPEKTRFGYLDEPEPYAGDMQVDKHMEFMFGQRQNYNLEYNVILSDDEFEDDPILAPEERDRRESDDEDYSLEYIEDQNPGPSKTAKEKNTSKKAASKKAASKKAASKKSADVAKVSTTEWGDTQEIVTQGGSKRAIKLGTKTQQELGKKAKYIYDQRHSVNL